MLSLNESANISLFLRVLAALREQQPLLATHANLLAIADEMWQLMIAVLDLLEDDELDELILRYTPEMALVYPTAPYLTVRQDG